MLYVALFGGGIKLCAKIKFNVGCPYYKCVTPLVGCILLFSFMHTCCLESEHKKHSATRLGRNVIKAEYLLHCGIYSLLSQMFQPFVNLGVFLFFFFFASHLVSASLELVNLVHLLLLLGTYLALTYSTTDLKEIKIFPIFIS